LRSAVDERGLGRGRELDGLAWSLPLDRLWEAYVEGLIPREVAFTGGEVRVGRLGQTTFQLEWSDPTHRSLGHLVPGIVARRGRSVRIVDAKYKAHWPSPTRPAGTASPRRPASSTGPTSTTHGRTSWTPRQRATQRLWLARNAKARSGRRTSKKRVATAQTNGRPVQSGRHTAEQERVAPSER
jgi:hypothetical protein